MSCVSQARARAGQLLFLRRNDLRGRGLAGVTCGDGPFVSVPLFMPVKKHGNRDLRGRTFCIRPLVHASRKTWGQTQKDRPHVPPMSPCLLRWTRFFDLEQVVDPGRKVFSQQSGGSDDDRHFSSGDDDHFALERPVYAFLRGLYRGDLFS